MAGFREHGNETYVSIKVGKFLDELSYCKLKNYTTHRNYPVLFMPRLTASS